MWHDCCSSLIKCRVELLMHSYRECCEVRHLCEKNEETWNVHECRVLTGFFFFLGDIHSKYDWIFWLVMTSGQTWNGFPFSYYRFSRVDGTVDTYVWRATNFSAWERMSCMTALLSLRTLLQIYNNQTKLWRWHLYTFARTSTLLTGKRKTTKKNLWNWALLHLFRTIWDWNLCDTGTMLILRWWARVDVKQCGLKSMAQVVMTFASI